MHIVRIEEDGTVLVVDGTELHSIHWDALCGAKVILNTPMTPEVLKALEEYETPLPKKSDVFKLDEETCGTCGDWLNEKGICETCEDLNAR